jgi:hypothetical protein
MNTNDFYKALFEKYALDEEKIRRNAVKAAKTPAWQRAIGAHWKTAVGAAAAVAVTVGAVAYTVGNSAGNIDIDPQENLPTAYQRLRDAELQYMNAAAEDESKADIYVSFLDDICFSDMSVSLSALPDFEDIDIGCLYLNDGTVIRGQADIEAYAENNADAAEIAGAKLLAPVKAFRDIKELSKVGAAEPGSELINDDTFSPIDFDDIDPLSDAYEFISTTAAIPESTTTPFSFEVEAATAGTSVTAVSDADTTEPPEDTEETDPVDDPEDTEEADPVEETDADNDAAASEGDTTGETTTAESEAPETSMTTEAETTVASSEITDPPEVGLMTQIYQLNVDNALETVLANDYAIVLTKGNVYIYKIGGVVSGIENVFEISNPKVAHIDDNFVILTGCGASGRRNTVLTLDMKNSTVTEKDAGESLGEAEIGTISYSSVDSKFFLKAVSGSKTYMYELITNDANGIQFRPLFEFEGVVSPAGYRSNWLWFTAADENMRYSLYSFNCLDGTLKEEYSFGSVCKVRRSKSFESFIVSTTNAETGKPENYVLDTSAGLLISADISADAMIAVRNNTVYIGQGNKDYTLSTDGSLSEVKGPRVIYTYKPGSRYQVYSSDPEKVLIAEKMDTWG